MAPRQRIRRATRWLALASTLALAACSSSGPPISAEGRSRCQRRADLEELQPLRPLVYQHCLGSIEAKLAQERREERQRRLEQDRLLAQALERCRLKRAKVQSSLSQLRQAEVTLARLRASGEPPLPAPPKPLNETLLQRYTREDAELDRQRYRSALASWQQRLAEGQALRQQRQTALDEAQLNLDRAALRLRQLQPDLLAKGIELDPVVARRVLACDPRELTATLSVAMPPASLAPPPADQGVAQRGEARARRSSSQESR